MSRSGTRKTRDSAASSNQTQTQAQAQGQTVGQTTNNQPRSQRDTTPLNFNSTARNSHSEAIPIEDGPDDRHLANPKRFRLASIILVVCILSFVLQTELTKFVQTSMGYHKPYFILYVSHSFWAIALPAQFIYTTYISRSAPTSLSTLQDRIDYFARLIRQSTSDLRHRKADYTAVNTSESASSSTFAPSSQSTTSFSSTSTVYTSREKRVLSKYLFWLTFGITTLFMVPSYLWYACVAMTSMANLTAIYNTACFFAYLFSILLLREKIVVNKVLAVFLSLLGVAVISLTTRDSGGDGKSAASKQSFSMAGDVLALVGAALYGFEEVVYKKYASPKVTPVTFANTLTGLMGVVTLTMLWVPIPLFHWIGHEIMELPTWKEFLSILMIATLGLIYNGCFMIVVSMTSPVFAAVGVMATIPLVALTDWALFHETIGWGNIVGGLSILAGFAILVRENRKR
ncbi:hypothetical protein BG015_005651 [Linnemannia schmuckeri]|uniref:EamA domain-containing protein n=1 Tax=Linnemannia schmuckeri TaxID=64567 RepID=A0A9P5VC95_9FUNG|nr:hypothetical protein BG015_005651 [Linnemannia schmuckeri]